jgi:uracil-DNA glycosylase
MPAETLDQAATAASRCTLCAPVLPLGPRPIFQVSPTARVLIISQAPGTKAHLSRHSLARQGGRPAARLAGDGPRHVLRGRAPGHRALRPVLSRPPGGRRGRPAPAGMRAPVAPPADRADAAGAAVLLVGTYAIRAGMGRKAAAELGETVRNFAVPLAQGRFPLPHPSWRTRSWAAQRPWFEGEVLPALREAVGRALRCGVSGGKAGERIPRTPFKFFSASFPGCGC